MRTFEKEGNIKLVKHDNIAELLIMEGWKEVGAKEVIESTAEEAIADQEEVVEDDNGEDFD